MVARLTPDQKAACSNHVGVKFIGFFCHKRQLILYKNHYETFASMYVDINCLHFKTALAIGRPGFEGFSTT